MQANKIFRILFSLVFMMNLLPAGAFAQSAEPAPVPQAPAPLKPIISQSLRNDVSPPLSSIAPKQVPEGARPVVPMFTLPKAEKSLKAGKPTLQLDKLQNWIGDTLMPSPINSFEGVSNVNGVLPPDTQGDVGPNHYVQWVNLSFAIWDKDGNLLYGPAAGNTLWSGFGGICETNNDGDPITLYDPIADRWLMSQFALGFPNNFHQCIAISQTGDPTGSWYRYDFQVSTSKMNDYPKFGVWPDAYYMTANQFDGATFGWAGAGVWAYERDAMLNGLPAQVVYFDLYSVNPNYGGMLPADLDGWNLPPDGAPGIFMEWDDSTWLGDPTDTLRIWEFTVDWNNPGASTFGLSGAPNYTIPTTDVDPDMCGFARNCIPQPGGFALDAISDRLMYRLQYRNFGSYQTLVTNHTVDADGSDHAGIHWFELRDTGSGWSLYQEGVYAPDDDHRWMGSVALDQRGNLALGFSVSSSSTYPSIRYAGRLVNDPPGALSQGEAELIAGSGYQQHNSGRWGDYSMMAVDPVDDCTFWYTQEYYATIGNAPWQTRIGSFTFPSCQGATGTLEGTVTEQGSGTPIDGAQITASSNFTFVAYSQSDGSYSFSAIPTGTYTVTAQAYGYQPSTVTNVDVFSGTVTTQDFSLVPMPTHVVSGTVYDAITGWPLYAVIDVSAPGFPGAQIWTDPVSGFYSVTLAEGITYTMVASAWVDGYDDDTVSVGPLTSDTTQDFALLANLATCNAPGYQLNVTGLYEDFESWPPTGWTIVDNTSGGLVWDLDSTYGDTNYTGGAGHAADVNSDANPSVPYDTELRTPVFDVASLLTTTLQYKANYQQYSSEAFDLDVSTDGGSTWTNVLHWAEDHGSLYSTPGEDVSVDLSSYLSGPNNMLRWRYYTSNTTPWDWYAQIDEVRMGTVECNPPSSGGLVVGNVYDSLTLSALNGADVSNEDGYATTSQATPQDDAVDDGFYTLFALPGAKVFTATLTGYTPDVETPTVANFGTVRQDFYLGSGMLVYTPSSLEANLGLGMTTTLPLTISNIGNAPVVVELRELDKGWQPLGIFDQPEYVVKPFKSNRLNTNNLGTLDPPDVPPYAAGDIIQSWASGLTYGWGLGFDLNTSYVWVGDIAAGGGTDLDYAYLSDGTSTGDTIDISWAGVFAADIAYNINTGTLWQVDVGGDNCIHELDPLSLLPTGNTICPSWTTSMRGLAYDPSTDTYFAGSWNDLMVYHFASDGTMLEQVNVGLDVAGLAYNPDTGHLFVIVNADPNPVYVLDVYDSYNNLGSFSISGFTANGGAGLAMDCNGHLWAIDQNTQTVYELDSGETTSMCAFDVPWLSENPITATVTASSDVPIAVTFDASAVAQPGTYYAQLKLVNDSPYDVPNVPVTMTVSAPPTWGKLDGYVTNMGYCDADPSPIEGAQVHIESDIVVSTTTQITATVLSEDFESWLPTGWMTVTNGGDCSWESTATTGRSNYAGGDGEAAIADSDWCGSGTTMDAELWTPAMDLSAYDSASLNFIAAYNDLSTGDVFNVDVSSDGGTSWTNLLSWNEDHSAYGPGEAVSLDLTPYLSANVVVRFHYTAGWDWWAIVDQVRVIGSSNQVTSTPVSWDVETDADGYYLLWLDQMYSPLTVTVSAPEVESGLANGIMVTAQSTTTLNFDLRWLQPCVSTNPTSLEALVPIGTSLTQTLSLINNGAVDSAYDFTEIAGTPLGPIPAQPFSDSYPRGEARPTTARAPKTNQSVGEQEPVAWLSPGYTAYAMDLFNTNLVSFDTDTPGTFNVIGSNGGGNYFAGDFLMGDFTKLYVLDYSTNAFGYFDTGTAAYTNIGTATPGSGESWTGMTGAGDGTLYASASTCSASTLYTINPATGAPTAIGTISNGPCIIDIAINPAGEMYGLDIVNDVLVKIDPATGAGTVVGSVGFDANYAQGMDFEDTSGTLFLAAYNNGTGQGELRVADTSTGVTTLVGAFAGGAEVDALAFATFAGGGGVPWLDEYPLTGNIGADGSKDVEITFTAFPTMTAGIYTATLRVNSDDPLYPAIDLPVTMTVVTAPTCSFLSTTPDELGDTTVFTNTTDEGFASTTYSWDFGDGSPASTDLSPSHVYALPGVYTVTLTAENMVGTDSCSAQVEVEGVVASFTSNSPVQVGNAVAFSNTTVAYPGVAQWFWTFGDGGLSTEENPTHMYAEPGVYTVTLMAATVAYGPVAVDMPENVYDIYVGTVVVTELPPKTIFLPFISSNVVNSP